MDKPDCRSFRRAILRPATADTFATASRAGLDRANVLVFDFGASFIELDYKHANRFQQVHRPSRRRWETEFAVRVLSSLSSHVLSTNQLEAVAKQVCSSPRNGSLLRRADPRPDHLESHAMRFCVRSRSYTQSVRKSRITFLRSAAQRASFGARRSGALLSR